MKSTFTKYLLTLALLCTGTVMAQNNNRQTIQLKTISETGGGNGNIAGITVISNLPDSTFIGVLPSASPNVRNNVVIQSGVQNWLQSFTNQQFGSSYKPAGKKLLWVVNDLSVGTDSSASDVVSFTKLSAAIYSGTANSFQPIGSFDTLMVSQDSLPDFGQNMSLALNALYENSITSTNFKGRMAANQTATAMSETALLQSLKSNNNYKILSDKRYMTGVFTSFQEFKDDAPSITHFYTNVDKATGVVTLSQLMTDSSTQPINNAWGLSINNELYRLQDGQLYAIEKDGNTFVLSKYLDYQTRKNQAIFWRNFIGRRQMDNNPFDDKHIYRKATAANAAIKIEATHLDMTTGNLTF